RQSAGHGAAVGTDGAGVVLVAVSGLDDAAPRDGIPPLRCGGCGLSTSIPRPASRWQHRAPQRRDMTSLGASTSGARPIHLSGRRALRSVALLPPEEADGDEGEEVEATGYPQD